MDLFIYHVFLLVIILTQFPIIALLPPLIQKQSFLVYVPSSILLNRWGPTADWPNIELVSFQMPLISNGNPEMNELECFAVCLV